MKTQCETRRVSETLLAFRLKAALLKITRLRDGFPLRQIVPPATVCVVACHSEAEQATSDYADCSC